jgi:CarboxypepD_reg-like domain
MGVCKKNIESLKRNIISGMLHIPVNAVVLLFLYFLLTPSLVFAQPEDYIKGTVTDALTHAPIANCSVFINNTSRGTTSGQTGEFVIRDLPAGQHQLIISSIGYQTFSYDFSSDQLPLDFKVTLNLKTTNLKEVTIEPDVMDGWRIWGKTFLVNFIGTTENAQDCTITNIKALHFHFSKKTNRLSVSADEPLLIENKALGYSIKYQLEAFYCDFHAHINFYLGFPFFTELSTDHKKQQSRWEQKRKDAYQGSMLHFMRELYGGKSEKEGFQLLKKMKVINAQKKQVVDMYKSYQALLNDTLEMQKNGMLKKVHHDHLISADSVVYYNDILSKPDYYEEFRPIPVDTLVSVNDDQTISLFFTDSIFVLYKNPKDGSLQESKIYLATPAPIKIYSNGIYFPPQEIIVNGFWGAYEKVANDLPIDYQPKEKQR